MKQKMLRGSVTIEASLILPFLIFLIWNLCYLSFFLYDQNIALQGNYTTALRAERGGSAEAEKYQLAEEKYKRAVGEKLVCAESRKEIEIKEDEITVTTKFSMKAPGGMLFYSGWESDQKMKVKSYEPVAWIRRCRSTENMLEQIQSKNKEE